MQLEPVDALSNTNTAPGCSSRLLKKYENNLIKQQQRKKQPNY